jgi:hypothetical protein
MTEVLDRLQGEDIVLKDIFRYEIDKVDEEGKVQGSFKAKAVPDFFPLFKKKGVELSEEIFKEK